MNKDLVFWLSSLSALAVFFGAAIGQLPAVFTGVLVLVIIGVIDEIVSQKRWKNSLERDAEGVHERYLRMAIEKHFADGIDYVPIPRRSCGCPRVDEQMHWCTTWKGHRDSTWSQRAVDELLAHVCPELPRSKPAPRHKHTGRQPGCKLCADRKAQLLPARKLWADASHTTSSKG